MCMGSLWSESGLLWFAGTKMDHLELIYCLDLHIVGSLNHVQKPFPSKLGASCFNARVMVCSQHIWHGSQNLQNGSLLVFDMRQTGAPIATLKGPSCNPIHTLQHVPEHSRLAEQGESVKETSGLLSASCSSLCFWSDIGSSNLQTDGYRQAHFAQNPLQELGFFPSNVM
jgi:hypothetical protein